MRARRCLAIAGILLALPAQAAAHADLRSLARGSGGDIRLVFSAPVEEAFLRVAAITAGGTRPLAATVDAADDEVVLVPAPPGVSGIEWRVLSQDGHVSSGVAAATRAEVAAADRGGAHRDSVAEIAAHVLLLIGLTGTLGLVSLRFAILGPAWRSGGPRPAGPDDSEAWRRTTGPAIGGAMAGWWRAWWSLGLLTAVGLVLGILAVSADLDTGAGGLGTLITDTRLGRAWLVEAAGVVLAVAAGLVLWRSSAAARAPGAPGAWSYGLGLPLAAAAVAVAWAGHASSGGDRVLGIAIDAVHLLATAAWLGGLVGLVCVIPAARRALHEASGTRLAAAVVVRFSSLAIACVATLIVTGVYRALAELRSLGDLVHTAYGKALLVKLILFAVLLVGGAVNRLVLHPRLERAALGLDADDRGAGGQLRVSVTAEIAMGAVLLVVVGVLVGLPPP